MGPTALTPRHPNDQTHCQTQYSDEGNDTARQLIHFGTSLVFRRYSRYRVSDTFRLKDALIATPHVRHNAAKIATIPLVRRYILLTSLSLVGLGRFSP